MSQMEANRARKIHFKRTKENFEEWEIAVKNLFLGKNDKRNDFFIRRLRFQRTIPGLL